MTRFLVRVRRGRGDQRSPYVLAEEITVQHPVIFRQAGRQSTIGGIPIRRMASTGRRDRAVFEVIVREGTTARGFESARSRDQARAQASAAGIKKVCRRLRPQEAARIVAIDTEIAELEGRIEEARDRRQEAVREAWARGNVVLLAEFEELARRSLPGPSPTPGQEV
ncbi:MAG TPA: hypothetical protein VHA80_06665 [Solirubrobacterales bacterium]|nr:hypothetical protein [Solirubrobacterales bacterium]